MLGVETGGEEDTPGLEIDLLKFSSAFTRSFGELWEDDDGTESTVKQGTCKVSVAVPPIRTNHKDGVKVNETSYRFQS